MISNTVIATVPTSATFSGWLAETNQVQAAMTTVVLTADSGNTSDPFSGANTIPSFGTVTHNGLIISTNIQANTISSISGNLTFISTDVILDSASNLSVGGDATFSTMLNANNVAVTGNTSLTNLVAGNSSIQGSVFSPGALTCGNTSANVNFTVYGNATFLGNVSGFQNLSDPRLKENLRAVNEDELEGLSKIDVYEFDWKKDAPREGTSVGVMADAMEDILPNLVSTNAMGYKEVAYDRLIPYLLLKIQRLEKEIERAKIWALSEKR